MLLFCIFEALPEFEDWRKRLEWLMMTHGGWLLGDREPEDNFRDNYMIILVIMLPFHTKYTHASHLHASNKCSA